MSPHRIPTRTTAYRVLALAVLLGAAAIGWGEQLAAAWLPLWRVELPLFLDPHWRVDQLAVDHEGSDQVIRLWVGLRDCVPLGGRQVCDPGQPLGNASTLVGNLSLPTTLLLALGLGWPSATRRERALRGLCLAGALLLLSIGDVPLTLASAFWGLWSDATQTRPPWALTLWAGFLQAGGRAALGLILGAGAIAAGAWLAGLPDPQRATP